MSTTTTTTTTVPGTVLPKSEEQDEKYPEEQVTRTVNKDGKVVLKRHGTFADIEVADEYNDPEHSALRPPTNVWSDMPNVTIEYRDIAYKIPVLAKENKIKTIYTALRDSFDVFRKPAMKEVRALAPCSGVIKPGTMTLILAPPGHGKSSFLKAIAGKLDGDKNFSGVVKYNGVTRNEALAQGVYTNRLAGFVEQVDIHLALLTVKETFRFALDNSVPDPKLLPDGGASWDSDKRVDEMIKLLGLGECQDVVVGNDLVRGISGGQKKRVTLGEMIIGNSRVLCLDEISTGLDAAATLDICTALRKWTHETNGSIVMSLLQPAPEVVELFDNLILLREGAVIYDGPRAQVLEHFKRIGVRCPDNEDHADFLVSFLTDPEVTYERQIKLELQLKHKRHLSADEVKAKWVEPKIPLNTPSLFNYFRSSRIYKDKEAELNELAQPNKNAGFDVSKMSAYTKAQYASAYPHSFWKHTALNLGRQAKYMRRNLSFIIPRYVQAVFMALVIGSLFSGLSADSFRDRLGLIIFFCANQGFSNFSEMPMAVEQKSVTFKQIGAGFYPALSFVLSVVSLHLPMATVEVSIFGVIVYWMTNFADDVGRFFFFLLIALCVNLAISVVFRFVVYLTSNQDVAQSISGPFVALSMLFAGFLITRDKIPKFLIWVYYLSPFSWALRSVAQNEYSHERYDALANAGNGQVDRLGNLYLSAFEIQTDLDYKWAGVGMLLGYFILFIILGALALTYKRVIFVIGTKRSTEEEELSLESQDPMIFSPSAPNDRKTPATPDIEGTPNYPARKVPGLELAAYSPNAAAYSPNATPASVNGRKVPDQVIDVSSLAHDKFALPFTPATLSWLDLGYTIFEGKEKKPKALLTGISGFARPGTLTALMGSSGAGKTTLMDVLAQRKTVGKIDGQILVNGRAVDPITFNRLIGYVEQNDLHVGTSTVREALLFSARLRLPPSISEAQRNAWVEEVLRLLELDDIANRIIGDAVIPGLSPGQLKRLTIGVELVANPTILFLDEPTSGLDSRVALQVMRVIRRIASTGRSVVCTIHQPSSELFFMFDRLLLLRSGGRTVYFGDVGEHGSTLTNYFENTLGDKSPKCPEWANPAAWMLDVIGAGTAGSSYDVDFAEVYNKSELQKKNAVDIDNASKPEKELVAEVDGLYAQPFLRQLKEVVVRQFQSYWRNIGFTYVRGMTMVFLGVVFGLLYLQISQGDYAGVNSTLAIFFMATGFSAVLNAATAMPVLFRTRAVFYREQSSHTYSPWAYAFANLATEVVYIWIYTLLFVVPCYFLVGLRSDASAFFKYVFVQYLMGLCFNILGQAMSAGMPNQVVAEIIQGVEFSFIFLFGGTFMAAGAIPAGWKWFYIINPLPKCVAAQAISQFSCTSDGSRVLAGSLCPQIDVITGSGGTVPEFTQNYVSDFIDAPFDAYWSKTGYLFLTIVVVEIIAMLCYRYVRHIKR